jgi:hypothetical protein
MTGSANVRLARSVLIASYDLEVASVRIRKQDRNRQKFARRRLFAEALEDRRLLAVTASILPDNHVVFEGDASADNVQFSVVDGYLYQNSNRDLDSTTPGEQSLLLSEISSLTYNDSGRNDSVTFAGTEAFVFGNASIDIDTQSIIVDAGARISTTDGAVNFEAERRVFLSGNSIVATVDGNIDLNGSSLGAFVLGNISTHNGDIEVQGFDIIVSGTIESAGVGPNAGSIRIGGADSHELRVTGNVATVDGDISIQNTLDPDSTSLGYTIITGTIASTGIGEDAGRISIVGEGNNTTSGGINLQTNAQIASVDGDISVVGSGIGLGVQISDGFDFIKSTGTGVHAASIEITGVGGDGGGGNIPKSGIWIFGDDSGYISTNDGEIRLTGTGGSNVANGSSGGLEFRDFIIESHAETAGFGNIYLTGQGGVGNDTNGIEMEGVDITTQAGNIGIEGTGGDQRFRSSHGVSLFDSHISSTGIGINAGTITIDGTGGIGSSAYGSIIRASTIESLDGTIFVKGQAGSGDSSGNYYGVALGGFTDNHTRIESLGTDTNAATITIQGTSGNTGRRRNGIELEDTGGVITSAYGDIELIGVSPDRQGIQITRWGEFSSTGTGPDAARITLDGSGGVGIFTNANNAITSIDGDIELRGAGSSYGIYATNTSPSLGLSTIQSTGTGPDAASITISTPDSLTWLSDSNLQVKTAAGRTEFLADRLRIDGAQVMSTGGPIAIKSDSFGIRFDGSIQSPGDLSITTLTPGLPIGLGGIPGLVDGFNSITIGDENTGVVSFSAATFQDDVTIIGQSTQDSSGIDIDVGDNQLTLQTTLTPGQSPGVFEAAGNIVLADNASLSLEIDGDAAGTTATSHDQVSITGTLSIGDSVALDLTTSNGHVPLEGHQYVIVENDGDEPITGVFDGLPEGTVIENFLGSSLNARISYRGLDETTGNDIVLTTTSLLNPIYDFSDASYSVTEGDADSTTTVVTLTRSGETSIATSVDVLLTNGTALAGEDFVAGPVTVNFDAGQTAAEVPITIFGDSLVEEDETLGLSLANLSDYGFVGTSNPTATLTITDDDFMLTTWLPQGQLFAFSDPADPMENGRHGWSVDVDGDVMAVGGENVAHIYRRNDAGTPNDTSDDVWLGEAQLIDGNSRHQRSVWQECRGFWKYHRSWSLRR